VILTADWVLPVTGRPIRDGAVLTRGPRIEAVGTIDQMRALAPDETSEHFGECVLMPGLVNAHTHLSLTVLGGLIPPVPMRPFLKHVTAAILAMSDDDFAASAALGALESLRAGVTCVGDIAYGPEPLAACADAGLAGVFYWEVFGIDAGELSGELAEREFPAEVDSCALGRTRCGLSPHAPYTAGPELLHATWNVAQRHRIGFAIHVAESPAERDLMVNARGPLSDTARRLATGFRSPGLGSVAYLEGLGVLKDAVAVHCVHLEQGDGRRLKRSVAGVVLCPRSNAYLANGDPPVAELSSAGIYLALGTDSAASNHDLDLFEEGRAARDIDRSLTSRRVIAMLTHDGARVLGLDNVCGAIEPGLSADLTVIRTGATTDPEAAVVGLGGRETVEAVMSAGLWRVRGGKSALPTGMIDRAAAKARSVAQDALEHMTD
jgi:cytosine/adenosine deaminase-related metal-dependent hydrolase